MLRLGLLIRTPPPSLPFTCRQATSWMSGDNDYNSLFKGLQSNVYDPSLKPAPRKRKHSDKLSHEPEDINEYQAALSMSLKIISNGYLNKTKSFILVTNDQNYLFNAGESTMRLMKSENLKVRKIENVLMTRADWESCGGLGSLTLELGNKFKTPLCFHSPIDWNLKHNMKLNRPFIDQSCQHVTQFDYSKKGYFEDKNLKIRLINFNITDYSGNLRNHPQLTNSYEITLKKVPPRFLVEKLESNNLKPGPWIRELKEGRPVTIDGRLYRPEEFLDSSQSVEKKLIVLDLPSTKSIDEIELLIDKFDTTIQVIAHLSDSHILHDPSYLAWIRSFTTECVHIFFDEAYPALNLESVYQLQAQLNLISENLFPLLHGQTKEQLALAEVHRNQLADMQKVMSMIQAETGMELALRPKLELNISSVIRPDNRRYMNQIFEQYEQDLKLQVSGGPMGEIKENLELLKLKINDQDDAQIDSSSWASFPKVLFLGTQSVYATNYRNVTSILVQTNSKTSILMDCGEGTLNQMLKFFGGEETDKQLVNIKVIFLTHIHMDHHGGVYGLILARIRAFKRLGLQYEKVRLMMPKFFIENTIYAIENLMQTQIFDYIQTLPNELFLNRSFQPRLFVKQVNIGQKYLIDEFSNIEQQEAIRDIKNVLGLDSLETIAVQHVGYSYAIILHINQTEKRKKSLRPPFKLVFSGDCRPNNCLVKKGNDCDLLIHECTFDNERCADAIRKNHCTIEEAVRVAQEMNAKQTVLTHFSARYGVLGHIDDVRAKNIGFSFDFMHLTPDNVEDVNNSTDLLKTLFKSAVEKNEDRRTKLQLHQQHQKQDT